MLSSDETREISFESLRDYSVLCGVEEEFLLIHKDGTLVEAADDCMVRAAEILEEDPKRLEILMTGIRGLDAEPALTQIEYVTLPLPPHRLHEAVTEGRRLLSDAAAQLGFKLLAQSLHPIQSDPNPIVGTHINVSVQHHIMNVEELFAVHNYFWNYLPELIALSANSPVFQGGVSGIASQRVANSSVLKPNGSATIQTPKKVAALVPIQYYGRRRYTLRLGSPDNVKQVVTNPRGDRLVDITPRGPFTNIGDDKDASLMTNRVEIRIFDVQHDTDRLVDIANLCCVSALHAVHLHAQGRINPDPYHRQNIEQAIVYGTNAEFARGDGKRETVQASVKQWVDSLDPYSNILQIQLNRNLAHVDRKQGDLKVEYKTQSFEQLRQQGKVFVVAQLRHSRTITDRRGRRYGISQGTQIQGRLAADYALTYTENDLLVSGFKSIMITNVLVVRGLEIPLESNDRILVALDESEYMSRRLFGGFGF
ncbi:MAG: glutamate-cysteine ligase family protein [Candidatus Thorarchaeota archaeon]